MTGVILNFPADSVVDWDLRIKLKPDILRDLERIAGPTPDERFLPGGHSDFDLVKEAETWAWAIGDYKNDDSRNRSIDIWFRDPNAALIFKLTLDSHVG